MQLHGDLLWNLSEADYRHGRYALDPQNRHFSHFLMPVMGQIPSRFHGAPGVFFCNSGFQAPASAPKRHVAAAQNSKLRSRNFFMDFDQLETFLEVARHLSFSRAAEKRFRTQPAISAQIRALEEEIGAKLLDRSGGKVSVTAAGKVFQRYAEESLAARKAVIAAVAEMERVPRGEIIVAANEGTCLHVLPEVFADFKKQYPGVAVNINRLE